MLLIPRTPSPVPLELRPVEEWTLEELRETARNHVVPNSLTQKLRFGDLMQHTGRSRGK